MYLFTPRSSCVKTDAVTIAHHESFRYLKELLRDQLQFDGVAVTDWADIEKLYDVHHVAATQREVTTRVV